MRGISKNQKPFYQPQLTRHTSQVPNEILGLRAQLRSLTLASQQRQKKLIEFSTNLRNEGIRNRKLKKQVQDAESKVDNFIKSQAQTLLNRNKNNKQSPLFYNQNGLSPFELVKIGQSRFQDTSSKNICMICYRDLQFGVKILKLPCTHLLHKQCAIQYLLYCKQCPVCCKSLK